MPGGQPESPKSDRLDAEQAARAVLGQGATAIPKSRDGAVEVIRMLRLTRGSAVKARTQAVNTLHVLIVTAPDNLREPLRTLRGRTLINHCLNLRPDHDDLATLIDQPARLLHTGATTAIHELARRIHTLTEQITTLDRQLRRLLTTAAPQLMALPGIGAEIAGQLLVTVGDKPDRLASEASFARLCGVAPQPASSGRTTGRHRLSRSGDRAAKSAIYMATVTRMRQHPPTRAYLHRRTTEGLTKREIIRCLKRCVAREIFHALPRTT
ncbi:transposase [Crossiella cryophila]|uniref:Transposase n=1 Tax=Crossiella cryophila TaxID=43355 RepID=A0A7W7FV42_9PSEU|nr:transposase [Crossiella cryophila]MBB4678650.1 transposase [Crossiella cryophila]